MGRAQCNWEKGQAALSSGPAPPLAHLALRWGAAEKGKKEGSRTRLIRVLDAATGEDLTPLENNPTARKFKYAIKERGGLSLQYVRAKIALYKDGQKGDGAFRACF